MMRKGKRYTAGDGEEGKVRETEERKANLKKELQKKCTLMVARKGKAAGRRCVSPPGPKSDAHGCFDAGPRRQHLFPVAANKSFTMLLLSAEHAELE
jgi:hypothetical protein